MMTLLIGLSKSVIEVNLKLRLIAVPLVNILN